MDNKADFFQKKMYNNRSFSRQKKTPKVWIWLFVVLLLLIVWLVAFKIFGGSKGESDKAFDFSLWDEVFLQWEIKVDGNIAVHPYTIDDINYGKIWIRSDSVNLSEYAGFVQLTGIVEKFYQSTPVVKVYSISWSKAWSGNEVNMVFDGDDGYYISEAGILLLPDFYKEYFPLNDWKDWKLLIKKIDSWEEIAINYFRCNSADPNRNCKWLNETFAKNNAQSFVTSEWDVFYKQSEDHSWFVSNGDWWGIFIHDVSDDVVFELKDLIKFANEKNINERVKSRATSICQWSWEKLQKINNSEINLKQEWLIVTVSGDGMEKEITCQILVDFSSSKKWELQSLTIWNDVVVSDSQEQENSESTWDVVDSPISATPFDTNVPQLQLKKECIENPSKEWCVQYKSSRWGYILDFPSPSISFSVSPIKEDFGRNDVKCSYVINVIKYTEKENLEISPAIRIYECDWSVEKSWTQWIVVYSRLGKKFIVQMNDWAWNDFSTNLKFEELTEE